RYRSSEATSTPLSTLSLHDALPIWRGRDHWWHHLMEQATPECEAEAMDAEDMLFLLYTSGTTGKPKGIVHTTAGYVVGVYATTKDRKSTRLNSSHVSISYAVFCLKK